MDGLAEFEKALEKEKEEREEADYKARRDEKHRHRHHQHKHTTLSKRRHRSASRDKDERHKQNDSLNRTHTRPKVGYQHYSRNENDGGDVSHEDILRHKRPRHLRPEITEGGGEGGGPTKERAEREIAGNSLGERSKMKSSYHDQKREEQYSPPDASHSAPVRDAWMTAPSGVNIDYVHRPSKQTNTTKETPRPKHAVLENELNGAALRQINSGREVDDLELSTQPEVTYSFGDVGSQWRMTKLNGVFTVAERSGRPIEEVAVERYGSLREFDDAQEEKEEMERRRIYGKGYCEKQVPSGDLYRARLERETQRELESEDHATAHPGIGTATEVHVTAYDQTALNRLRAQLMKAKLLKLPNAAKLESEYNIAVAESSHGKTESGGEQPVVLDARHSRLLAGRSEVKAVDTKRGRERGLVEANEDMTVEDMVREERRTRGEVSGEGARFAERIAKDVKFDDNLDYLDENAEKLARYVHKSESGLRNMAVGEFTKMTKIIESCPLCHHEDRQPPNDLPLAPIAALATKVYLTLPTDPELTGAEGGAVVVPLEHHNNLLECSDDEWEEIRNFMKSLTRLYHDQGREVIFYENAAMPNRRMHAALVAVPIPYDLGDTAPAFFKEAILSEDEEWSQHKKIIDTGKRAREGSGKLAFRRSIAKEMPYFHVWFTLDGGLGHIVEDASRWPKGDLFARGVIGGMLDVDASIIKRQGRWTRNDSRLSDFKKRWRKFDWTRVLTEG